MEQKPNISYKIIEYFNLVKKVIALLWNSSKSITMIILFLNLLMGILTPINMIIWKSFINETVSSFQTGNIKMPVQWILFYFVVIYLNNVLGYWNEYFENILSSYINSYTSKLIMKKVERTEMKYFDDAILFDKIQKVNIESTGRSMSILTTFTNFIKSTSIFIGTLIILLNFNPLLMVICILTCIPTLIVSMKVAFKQYEIYESRFENLRFIAHLKGLVTNYENIKEMKINNITGYFINYIMGCYKDYIKEDKKIRGKFSFSKSAMNLLEEGLILLLKIYITISTILQKGTIGDLTLYISSIDNFRNSVIVILNTIVSIFDDGLYLNNFFSFIELEDENSDQKNEKFNKEFKTIEFKNVWFKYPKTNDYILRGINMVIESKQCYSFVGLNGSGKTTLIKLLLKLYEPDQGEIIIDGVPLKDLNTEDYYNSVGIVFQDFVKYPLDIQTNIGFGDIENVDDMEAIKHAAKLGGASDFIEKLPLKYKTRLQREWSDTIQLSLGQWQKLAISRAFMKKFPIVILDEPTASLDPEAEYDLFKKFKEIMEGKTCVLVAHRFSTVKLANKIFVLKGGEIIEQGSHNKLMILNGEYAKLYNMQAETFKEKGEFDSSEKLYHIG